MVTVDLWLHSHYCQKYESCIVIQYVGKCKVLKLLQSAEELEAKRLYEMEKPLSDRLKVARTDAFDPLPPQLLRKVSLANSFSNSCSLAYYS